MRNLLRNCDFGPIVDPLDISLPSKGPASATLAKAIHTQTATGRMHRFRAVPVARRAWFVTLTSTEVMHDSFAPGQLVRGMEFRPQQFWVHARRVARKFIRADHEAGGNGSAFAVEYRHCKVCNRILLASDAKAYRERERWPERTWHYPQGPACSVDCKPVIIRNSKYKRKEVV